MIYPQDRRALKHNARGWIGSAVPSALLVTLVYLLVTDGIYEIINLFIPVQEVADQASQYMMSGDLDSAQAVLYQAIQGATGLPFLFVLVLYRFYNAVINYGYTGYSMAVTRNQSAGYGEVFSRFYMAGKIILAEILSYIFVLLWSMLFIFPGVIAAYRYRMVPYILLDDPECPILEAFRQSKAMMRGRKWELFVVDISFLPLVFGVILAGSLVVMLIALVLPDSTFINVLSVLVTMALNIWLTPYQEFTYAQWYDGVRIQQAQQGREDQPPFGF